MQLHKFLNSNVLAEVVKLTTRADVKPRNPLTEYMHGIGGKWVGCGPPHLQRIMVYDPSQNTASLPKSSADIDEAADEAGAKLGVNWRGYATSEASFH